MSHIFISYSQKDSEFVRRLADDLEASGLEVWYFEKDAKSGVHPDTALDEGLRSAGALVVVVSPDSVTAANVRDEVSFARFHDQRVIVVLCRPAGWLAGLESVEWVDFSLSALYASSLHKLSTLLAGEFGLLSPPDIPGQVVPGSTVWSGNAIEVAEGELTIPNDPRDLSPIYRRHYGRMLAVLAAPYCNASGDGPPRFPLHVTLNWYRFAGAMTLAMQAAGHQNGFPLFLKRLMPPTLEQLNAALDDKSAQAFQIVHWIGNSENETLYLEDEWGYESVVTVQHLVNALQKGAAQLLVMQAPTNADVIQRFLSETPLEAVINLKALPSHDSADLFIRRFYATLLETPSVKTAFESAISAVREMRPEDGELFGLTFKNGLDDVQLQFPTGDEQAACSLIDPGMPPVRNVPLHVDFVGQRVALSELSREIGSTAFRQMAIYGQHGVGKSWMAAEYVARFGWRYPDGILWMRVSRYTQSDDVIGQLLILLGLPLQTNWATLRDILHERQVLVVLDQADEWGEPFEIGELSDFIARLDHVGGTRILLTAWGPVQPLTFTAGTEENRVERLSADEAQRLAWQLIEQAELQQEIGDGTTLSNLLANTHGHPWLIRKAIELVRLDGVETALQDLAEFSEASDHLYDDYVAAQIRLLSRTARNFLRRLQGLPAGVDRQLLSTLGGETAHEQLRELISHSLLQREGQRFIIPIAVRNYLRGRMPLSDDEQAAIDTVAIQQLLAQQARVNE